MTQTQRKRRRRTNGGSKVRNAALIGAGIFVGMVAIGIISVVGWVISVAATTPNIDELKPIDKGQTSAIYAANGATAVGIEAAAEIFFSKHAKDLTLDEAALLAGLPQAPSDYNPFRSPQAALGRRNAVLRAMVKSHYLDAASAQAAMQHPLGLN